MKFIFDFDNVLLQTRKLIKEQFYPFFEAHGIKVKDIDEYYRNNYSVGFSMKNLLTHFSLDDEYEEVMRGIEKYRNNDAIDLVKKIGKEHCWVVSFGDEEFQLDKIKRAGIQDLFSEIIIVTSGKKDSIEKICAKFPHEEFIFVDDKAEHFKDLGHIPNLKTILFDEDGLAKLKALGL